MRGVREGSKAGAVGVLLYSFLVLLLVMVGCHSGRVSSGGGGEDGSDYDPRNISRTETQSVGPQIASGPDGTVYVVWMDGSETGYEAFHIYFRYKPSGGDWSDIEILSDTTIDSWAPHLACDPFGNVHLVWEEHDPDFEHSKIYYRMRKPTGEWTSVEVLATGGALQPRIAVDPSGTVHVVWNSESEGGMQYREKAPGETWSQIETAPAYVTNPDISTDAGGGVHVVFESLNQDIFYLYHSPTGTWSEPINVSKSEWYSQYASVSIDPLGRLWVSWSEAPPRGQNIPRAYYAIFQDSVWSEPKSLPYYSDVCTKKILFPRSIPVYIFSNCRWGGDIVVFRQREGRWEEYMTLGTETGGSLAPDAVLDEQGRVHVVWGEWEGMGEGSWEIYYEVVEP